MSTADHAAVRPEQTPWSRLLFVVLATVLVVRVAAADDDVAGVLDTDAVGFDDYDPWQPFNEKMFFFNHDVLDRFLMKPVAKGWDKAVPDVGKRALDRVFDNLGMPKRLVNNLLQGRFVGAGHELARFGVNTTLGVGGLIDVAKMELHIERSDADTGQTLGMYGVGPGPYLVLPTLRPLTVRDGIGYGVDAIIDPFAYVLPFFGTAGIAVVKQVNERALNLEVFQDAESSVLDLYSAVRNGYLQHRRRAIEEAGAARHAEWHPPARAVVER